MILEVSPTLGASVKVTLLPPLNVYPLPGTCNISLIKIRITSCTLILEPLDDLIEIVSPALCNWNTVVFPSNLLSQSSRASRVPSDHPLKLSL